MKKSPYCRLKITTMGGFIVVRKKDEKHGNTNLLVDS